MRARLPELPGQVERRPSINLRERRHSAIQRLFHERKELLHKETGSQRGSDVGRQEGEGWVGCSGKAAGVRGQQRADAGKPFPQARGKASESSSPAGPLVTAGPGTGAVSVNA